jgi:hypothetical protein
MPLEVITMALPFDPRLARQVKADELIPQQQPTPPALKTSADYREQVMLKHPYLSEFHSPAEHLHAALLEGDPEVISYVPQPFRLMIGKRRYNPDCYVVTNGQPRRVLELKPDGEMPDELQHPLTHFFAQHGMVFEVISNESVFERRIEAENWVEIVRILYQARSLDTTAAEQNVAEQLEANGKCTLGDLIDPGDRERTYYDEIALFRLLYQGHIKSNLNTRTLDFDTEFSLCG